MEFKKLFHILVTNLFKICITNSNKISVLKINLNSFLGTTGAVADQHDLFSFFFIKFLKSVKS